MMPADPATRLVLVKPTLPFAGLKVLFHGPPTPADAGNRIQPDRLGCVRPLVFDLGFLAQRAPDQEPLRTRRQSFFGEPHHYLRVFVRAWPLAPLGNHDPLP